MHFYDKQQRPIDPPAQLTVGTLFAIGVLDARPDLTTPLVGLFIEDDDNYHLKTEFDAGWLPDLVQVATRAMTAVPLPPADPLEARVAALESRIGALLYRLQHLPTSDNP